MKSIFKRTVSVMTAICLLFCMGVTAFVAGIPVNGAAEPMAKKLVLNKVNGIYLDKGGSGDYTTTTNKTCSVIKVQGATYDSSKPTVTNVHVYKGFLLVAYGTNIPMDGEYHPLDLMPNYSHDNISAGTYRVELDSPYTIPYDCSTYFYYYE